ncbi:hypothetical protein KMZ68_12800 [Bradyrhizobium sediminis]|uniref:Pentapeptide repeat-containing protein n=1 Tax=Bradyrhizobium sediminis TaxID=2840469 RepID=A0A975RUY1_9BRAD|nr:hypothetical protein [Bradyrhizobium sediminis]QWG20639.1 hypothetical protein KMZ68_12800 [Bradyrhizobium sediminis]
MLDPMLRADCARCAALCCVYLAFDRSELFAIDKASGEPCPHLVSDCRCAIHAELNRCGFGGCARYDCLGAGQHVVQHLFGGRSWQENPVLTRSMLEAFRAMRRVHELLHLLHMAGRLPLTTAQAVAHDELRSRLLPAHGWTLELLADFECGTLSAEVRQFLSTLRDCVPPQRRPDTVSSRQGVPEGTAME